MVFLYEDISGTLVNYFSHCKRQAWLFNFGIRMEDSSEEVKKGKYVDRKSFSRKQEIDIGGERIKIDFIDKSKTPVELHEVKVSKKPRDDHRLQLAYYMLLLEKRGVPSIGIIHYPEIRVTVSVDLNEVRLVLNHSLDKIVEVMNGPCPPRLAIKLCKGCAFLNFCFADSGD